MASGSVAMTTPARRLSREHTSKFSSASVHRTRRRSGSGELIRVRMMLSDQWTIMNNSSSELDSKQPGRRRSCCRLLLWSSVVLLVTAAVVTATAALLHLHHVPLPFLNSPPSISPHPAPGALVWGSLGFSVGGIGGPWWSLGVSGGLFFW
ncbi:uncharacterized protein ACNS7B_011776 [Menidia menidia]